MADNVAITPGSGDSIAADDIGGAKFQRIKLIHGADGTNDGDVASGNPLPVVQTGALPAGTNAIGKLAANDGVDIGDVDVTSCALPTGAATGAKQDTGNTSLSSIDGKITACNTGAIEGTVTANLSATDNAVLDAIAASADSIDGKITACNTGAVVVSGGTLTLGANSGVDIGDVDVASCALPTGAATSEKQDTGNSSLSSIDGKITACNTGAVVVTSGSIALSAAIPAGTNAIGSTIPNQYELAGNTVHVNKYYTYAGAVTDGIIWSPAAGKRWYITDLIINVSEAATVTLEDDLAAGDSPILKLELAANGGISTNFRTPLFSGEDAADLIITTSAGNVYVTVSGYEI